MNSTPFKYALLRDQNENITGRDGNMAELVERWRTGGIDPSPNKDAEMLDRLNKSLEKMELLRLQPNADNVDKERIDRLRNATKCLCLVVQTRLSGGDPRSLDLTSLIEYN